MSDDTTPTAEDSGQRQVGQQDAQDGSAAQDAGQEAPGGDALDTPPAVSEDSAETDDLPPGAIPETADADDPTTGGTTDADASDGSQQ